MFKKLVCLTLCLGLLAAMTVCASADISYVTTTSDVAGEAGKISVTSTVTGAAEGDQLTYLAYRDAAPTDGTIVYIDQYEVLNADNGQHEFTYKTAETDIGSTVKFGGLTAAGAAMAVNDNNPIPAGVCRVTITNNTSTADVARPVSTDTTGFTAITYTTAQTITGVSVGGTALPADDWFTADGAIWVKNSHMMVEAVALTMTEETAAVSTTVTSKWGLLEASGSDGDSIMVIGSVPSGASEYGILITKDSTFNDATFIAEATSESDTVEISTGISRFAALGKGSDGSFAVKITNALGVTFGTDPYYVRVYALTGSTYTYGAIGTIGRTVAPDESSINPYITAAAVDEETHGEILPDEIIVAEDEKPEGEAPAAVPTEDAPAAETTEAEAPAASDDVIIL